MDIDTQSLRYGSARFAETHEIRRAGMFKQQDDALLVGFIGNTPLWYSGAGGMLLVAGARGGKLRDILGYNVCHGVHKNTLVTLDMKGELAAISQNLIPDKKYAGYWNPSGLHGLPRHRINPVSYMKRGSPSLVSDVKVFCENMITASGSVNADYFEGRGREFLEGIVLALVEVEGALTLPSIYRAINLIPAGGEEWLDIAYDMCTSGHEISKRVEEEIAVSRKSSSNGFQGILGEIFKAFACLSDPTLMESVSPPYDLSIEDICTGGQNWQFYMMPPAEFVQAWSPVIKSLFVSAMIYKSRAPQSKRQTWLIDECAQLNKFPLISKLYSYGAGIGIRPYCVFQSNDQMKAVGPNAENIITSSAQIRSYFAVRDIETASKLSRMLGDQTLEFDNKVQQAEARQAKRQAAQAFLNGEDPITASLDYAHYRDQAEIKSKQRRALQTPDEVLNMPNDKQYIFCDALRNPIYADRKPYYEQSFMAGRYHPNPYHPPLDSVRVKTMWGKQNRRVVTETVSSALSHFPQYSHHWSYIEGYKP